MIGTSFWRASSSIARDVEAEVRRAVGHRDALLEERVRVDLRRGDVGVRVAQALLEGLERQVHVGGLAVHLGRAAPHGDEAVAAVVLGEAPDVARSAARPGPSWSPPVLTLSPCRLLT